MNREDFLKRLKEDLHALTDEERLKGLQYYEEYFGCREEEVGLDEPGEAYAPVRLVSSVQHGRWVYLSDDTGLYKQRVNGSGRTKLNDKQCDNIKISGEWVYYICAEGIFRTHTDGTLTFPVLHRHEHSEMRRIISVAGKWVYYITSEGELHRVKAGGKRNKALEDNIRFITAADKYIIYGRNDGGIYKLIAGSKKQAKLCEDMADAVRVERSWIYYDNLSDGGRAYKIRIDGKRRQVVE